ncbi:hypothetical protein JXE04_01615 [Patescibacteria group bacterium]|nr:hypothetical protein [Patescibacteria group bacterium]
MPSENKLEQINQNPAERMSMNSKIESVPENKPEHQEMLKTDKKSEKAQDVVTVAKTPATKEPVLVDDYHRRRAAAIDDILEDGLDSFFLQMNAQEQKRFKEAGEKTALKINQLLDKAKFSLNKIVSLIKRWLSLIPKTNKYFLEQEAKIKADKIFKINKNL